MNMPEVLLKKHWTRIFFGQSSKCYLFWRAQACIWFLLSSNSQHCMCFNLSKLLLRGRVEISKLKLPRQFHSWYPEQCVHIILSSSTVVKKQLNYENEREYRIVKYINKKTTNLREWSEYRTVKYINKARAKCKRNITPC